MVDKAMVALPTLRPEMLTQSAASMLERLIRQTLGDESHKRTPEVAKAWSVRSWVPAWAVREYPHAGWDFDKLSCNPAMSLAFIEETALLLPWNWKTLSMRADVTGTTPAKYPGIPWGRTLLGLQARRARIDLNAHTGIRSDASPEEIVNFVHMRADIGRADPDLVRRNLHLPFNFRKLSSCAELHDLAIEFPAIGWDWTIVSIHASLDRFMDRPDLFDPRRMCFPGRLSAGAHRRIQAAVVVQCAWRKHRSRQVAACMRIQRAWTRARCDPNFAVCRKRIADLARKWDMSCGMSCGMSCESLDAPANLACDSQQDSSRLARAPKRAREWELTDC